MTTPVIYNKQQLSKMIENKNPTVSFTRPKHAKTTNTAAERLFSASGHTITDTRTRLSAEKVHKLMFIKKEPINIKKGEKRSIDNDYDNDGDIIFTDDDDPTV
ncbi:unnamed protein product [Rotaria magnacalcarata]|uniref:HAT C-terminal dimerisation domain-containing protein n=1 Tax=Rotaria magnacalcarata TaxID=392030 RepID=A0A816PQH0_9BILA|nr:unnamed protein product [Rotaria magnacalcarata]CAF1660763.1 unnamed protein product [Rotaria magnacalcarata]CAF2050952.1 unnamed protein product [Rotaria magnacalcarata]CAF2066944.1 unnamed protein product [Rotaria magnacalcarata]